MSLLHRNCYCYQQLCHQRHDRKVSISVNLSPFATEQAICSEFLDTIIHESATYTLPSVSIAIPHGSLNSPFPLPEIGFPVHQPFPMWRDKLSICGEFLDAVVSSFRDKNIARCINGNTPGGIKHSVCRAITAIFCNKRTVTSEFLNAIIGFICNQDIIVFNLLLNHKDNKAWHH